MEKAKPVPIKFKQAKHTAVAARAKRRGEAEQRRLMAAAANAAGIAKKPR